METAELTVDTSRRQVVDITDEVQFRVRGWGGDGLLSVFLQHATAGLALMETNSGSEADLAAALGRVLPRDVDYRHQHGSRGHGADHLLPALLSPSVVIPVTGGALQLGTWQSIVVVDLNPDNPTRRVRLSFLRG